MPEELIDALFVLCASSDVYVMVSVAVLCQMQIRSAWACMFVVAVLIRSRLSVVLACRSLYSLSYPHAFTSNFDVGPCSG